MAPSRYRDGEAIASIEAVIQAIVECLTNEEPIFIPIRYRQKVALDTTASAIYNTLPTPDTKISWPAKTQAEAKRFTIILRILDCMHEALTKDVVVSKRNIFYSDPGLFGSQGVVDRYVDILADSFDLHRADLHVTAAAKGLVAGSYAIERVDGTTVRVGDDGQSRLVEGSSEINSVYIDDVAWILVIEKESTYQTLVFSDLHRSCNAGSGIIITAKGYPDISTRSLLRQMSKARRGNLRHPPIFALVDFDPDGISIMSIYKHGSYKLSHENGNLKVPSIQWLGIRSGDIHQNVEKSTEQDYQGLLKLSVRDRKKAIKMLENNAALSEGGGEHEWRRELQVMLMIGVKAEMEILDRREGGIERWVRTELELRVRTATWEAAATLDGLAAVNKHETPAGRQDPSGATGPAPTLLNARHFWSVVLD